MVHLCLASTELFYPALTDTRILPFMMHPGLSGSRILPFMIHPGLNGTGILPFMIHHSLTGIGDEYMNIFYMIPVFNKVTDGRTTFVTSLE